MKIQEVLRKENIGKKFKGLKQVWEVFESLEFDIYEVSMKNVNDKAEYIDSWNTLYEIVNEEFEEVK